MLTEVFCTAVLAALAEFFEPLAASRAPRQSADSEAGRRKPNEGQPAFVTLPFTQSIAIVHSTTALARCIEPRAGGWEALSVGQMHINMH